MAHAVDQARSVEGFPVQQRAQIGLDGLFVRPIPDILFHVFEHLNYLDVRTAVLGPFQAGQRRRHGRIGVGARRSNHMHGEGRVVAAAVLGVQHQRQIQDSGLQLGIFAIRAQDVQQVFSGGKLGHGVVDEQAFVQHIVAVRLITVYREHGEQRNELQALAQYILGAVVRGPGVVAVQRQHTAGQRIHHVGVGRLEDDVAHEIRGQRAVARQQLLKIIQLCLIRQRAKQKQINGFLKAVPLFADKSRYDLLHIHAAVKQLAFAGHLFAVYHFAGLYFTDLCQACVHAVAVQVAQAAVDSVLHIHFRLDDIVRKAQLRQRLDLGRNGRVIDGFVDGHSGSSFSRCSRRVAAKNSSKIM